MKTLIAIGVIAAYAAIGGLIFMLLWNFLAPLFGGPVLSFWQACALNIALGIIARAFRNKRS